MLELILLLFENKLRSWITDGFFRMPSVPALPRLPWLPGSKPTCNTPMSWSESSLWKRSRHDWSRKWQKIPTVLTLIYFHQFDDLVILLRLILDFLSISKKEAKNIKSYKRSQLITNLVLIRPRRGKPVGRRWKEEPITFPAIIMLLEG